MSYRIKAVNRGTFTVPPVFAESMYDKKVQGLTPYKESLTIVK